MGVLGGLLRSAADPPRASAHALSTRPYAPRVNDTKEGHGRGAAVGLAQPAAHPPSVGRERCGEDLPVSGDTGSDRRGIGEDQPDRGHQRLPASLPGDQRGELGWWRWQVGRRDSEAHIRIESEQCIQRLPLFDLIDVQRDQRLLRGRWSR